MSSLCRAIGKTAPQLYNSRRLLLKLVRSRHSTVRGFATTGKNFTDKYAKRPECKKVTCDPEILRTDDVAPPELTRLKVDQISSYPACPPRPPRAKISCADLPREPIVNKKKRKPFVAVASCKTPKISPDLEPCNKMESTTCPKVTILNCPPALVPPNCKIAFVRPECEKLKSPFPAYSECFKPPKVTRKDECLCYEPKSVCL